MIAVKSLDSAGGAQRAGGQDVLRVEGQPVVLRGDPVTSHGEVPHDGPVMVGHVPWFTVNGTPVCRAGDAASCGHASTGRPWFRVVG